MTEPANKKRIIGGGLHHWLKFNTVGAIGIGVQLAALALFKSGLKLNYLMATGLAVETAVLHNFWWHERWTWADRSSLHRRVILERLVRFNLTNGAISILGNLIFMRLFVGQFHLAYIVANLISIALCSLLNFFVSDLFVFQPSLWSVEREEDPNPPA
ncbi:MAG: GtrA family protein [Acidobacteriia bacterium]|nr:GtrA family protein [Terriglobia bacterium]